MAIETRATEVLYGGAVAGGKSFLMREAAVKWCTLIPGLQVYLFRRQYGDLIKNHMEGRKGFRAKLAGWVAAGLCEIVKEEIRFYNGSKIFLCHCHNEKDIYNYQGSEMDVLLIDEITHFTQEMYRFLRGRLRQTGLVIPKKFLKELEGKFPRILCGGNPGNIGHLWVKNTWVTPCPPGRIRQMDDGEGGMMRQYIPARLEDNPSIMLDDPGYERRLKGLGSEALVKALRWGDWDVIEGAFFDCWSTHKHVIAPFSVPPEWVRFRSMDWGFASPFSIGWWAVVQDDYVLSEDAVDGADAGGGADADGRAGGVPRRILPRGAIIRYREWYGKSDDGKGLRMDADEVARQMVKLEYRDKIAFGVLDPSAFKHETGPSIAERINMVMVNAKHTSFREADNTRVPRAGNRDRSGPMSGWDEMRRRMVGIKGRPMIYWFSTCLDSIRTIPSLQHDPARAEDLDTHLEDHAADDTRYACMGRPWVRPPTEKPAPKDGYMTASESIANDSFKTM